MTPWNYVTIRDVIASKIRYFEAAGHKPSTLEIVLGQDTYAVMIASNRTVKEIGFFLSVNVVVDTATPRLAAVRVRQKRAKA